MSATGDPGRRRANLLRRTAACALVVLALATLASLGRYLRSGASWTWEKAEGTR